MIFGPQAVQIQIGHVLYIYIKVDESKQVEHIYIYINI